MRFSSMSSATSGEIAAHQEKLIPAFPAQVTNWKVLFQEFSQLAECSAHSQ
jgi:hypothetical protein